MGQRTFRLIPRDVRRRRLCEVCVGMVLVDVGGGDTPGPSMVDSPLTSQSPSPGPPSPRSPGPHSVPQHGDQNIGITHSSEHMQNEMLPLCLFIYIMKKKAKDSKHP